jgi:hypothetical protein
MVWKQGPAFLTCQFASLCWKQIALVLDFQNVTLLDTNLGMKEPFFKEMAILVAWLIWTTLNGHRYQSKSDLLYYAALLWSPVTWSNDLFVVLITFETFYPTVDDY